MRTIDILCPTCKIPLVVAERQGVEIDYCPTCRGIWLDRGELDKIIERAGALDHRSQPGDADTQGRAPPTAPSFLPQQPRHYSARHGDHHSDHRYEGDDHPNRHGKQRKSFLSDVFDFD